MSTLQHTQVKSQKQHLKFLGAGGPRAESREKQIPDFNKHKLNINFINYLHPVIFFTHLHMYFFKPFCLCCSGTCNRKRDVCCKS